MNESFAESLNRDCQCISIDRDELERETRRLLEGSGVDLPQFAESSLFASVPVFVSKGHIDAMSDVVRAVGALTTSPEYREIALARAAEIVRREVPQSGVFFGYDFHLSAEGPQLIEINTNAGGPLLNVFLARAQQACCPGASQLAAAGAGLDRLEHAFVDMFRNEWALGDPGRPLQSIAIVDDEPTSQFLYPEFLLFRELFRREGIEAFVLAPEQLRYERGALLYEQQRIDLVYNRLVDFYLDKPQHEALRSAYLQGAVVVTPHPRAHALFADKRNLITLRDPELHGAAGIAATDAELLMRHIPETRLVDPDQAAKLWAERKSWFMKPIHGYGGKAAYRGDKLTRGTFQQILQQDYIAQRVIAPSQRNVLVQGAVVPLKLDVRCFVYGTDVQLVAARLYHGQTTNFRTTGGGFAPVFTALDPAPGE